MKTVPPLSSSAGFGCAVKVAVGGLNYCCIWRGAIGAIRLGAKTIKGAQCTLSVDFEDCAAVSSAAGGGCPIQFPVGRLNQATIWKVAVRAVRQRAEAVDRCQCAARSDFENGSIAIDAAAKGCPIEVTIAAQR